MALLHINLLPETARKNVLSPIEQFHRTPLMWVGVVLLVGVALSVWAPVSIRRQQLAQLTVQIQELTPKKQAVDQLQQFVQRLRAQEAAFHRLGRAAGGWSRRLNVLSNVTPDGVWYTELVLNKEKGLLIYGSAIGEGGNETVNIGRLVQDLKADEHFSAVIKDIQIESIKRFQQEELELVQFTLACALAEPATP